MTQDLKFCLYRYYSFKILSGCKEICLDNLPPERASTSVFCNLKLSMSSVRGVLAQWIVCCRQVWCWTEQWCCLLEQESLLWPCPFPLRSVIGYLQTVMETWGNVGATFAGLVLLPCREASPPVASCYRKQR